MNTTATDRIEKQRLLRAPRARVWRAIADSGEFGTWFQVKIEQQFTPGGHSQGAMTYPGHEGTPIEMWIERMEPESLFSFRWHPGADQPDFDFASEETTLVEFHLAEAPEGTLLTIVESGFDKMPPQRRAQAFSGNSEGWTFQIEALAAYVERDA
jgi:uncharacterized protein YndB with AHSA1/START domain